MRLGVVMDNSGISRLRALRKGVNAKHGRGSMSLSQRVIPISRLSTGSITFDVALGGGVPVGRVTMIHGKKSCLSHDALVHYMVESDDGSVSEFPNHTIRELFERFHGDERPSKVAFFAYSKDDSGSLYANRIVDVIHSGEQECFRLRVGSGHSIVATAKHRFWTGESYVRLGDLVVGNMVSVSDDHNRSRWVAYAQVDSIESVGIVDTYDVSMMDPHNNFLANGFVVHNSGKTYTALSIAAHAQRLCANCLREVEIDEVKETHDPDTGEVEYFAVAQCDCYSKGIFTPRPFPHELDPRSSDGLRSVEMEVKEKGKSKKRRVKAFEWRCEELKKNSYEEFRVGFIDAEKALDLVWADKIGLDVRRLILELPSTAEEAVDIYDALIRTGAVDLLIVDSIAQMTPSKEIEVSSEDDLVGVQARLVNRMCRKTVAAMTDTWKDYGKQVTQLWINQVRMKVNAGFGSPEVRPGGMGQDFVNSCEVKMWSSNYEQDTVDHGMGAKDVMKVAHRGRLNFEIVKNKTAPPKGSGSFVLDFRTGKVDQIGQIVSLCERYGFLSKASPTKWDFRGKEFSTKTAAVEEIKRPMVWRHTMSALMKSMMGVK